MAHFQYKAKDKAGGTVSGTVEAQNPSHAASKIRELGHLPMEIVQVRSAPIPATTPSSGSAYDLPPVVARPILPAVSASQMAMFWRQFSTMMRSGMSIMQTMSQLAKNNANRKIGQAALDIYQSVSTGHPMSQGIARHPGVFTPQHALLIEAGEVSGQIESMGDLIAEDLEREASIRRKIATGLIYPVILILAVIFIPPIPTLILGNPMDYLRQTLGTLFGFVAWIAAFYFLGRLALRSPAVSSAYDHFKLTMPVIGPIVRKLTVARFCRVLSSLYHAGVPITRATFVAASSCGNRVIGGRLASQIGMLEKGSKLTEVMTRSGVFSPMVLSMAATGEFTGDVGEMLGKVAQYLEDDAGASINRALIIAPVLLALVVMGFIGMQVIRMYAGVLVNYR